MFILGNKVCLGHSSKFEIWLRVNNYLLIAIDLNRKQNYIEFSETQLSCLGISHLFKGWAKILDKYLHFCAVYVILFDFTKGFPLNTK